MQTPDLPPLTSALEQWFRKCQRPLPWRVRYDPYEVWVSEVMAQQTRLEVVVRYFPQFVARFPTIEALASAREEDVLAAWSGLGYYRRARMLRSGAIDVVARFGGRLPSTVAELMSIDGIGRYTAGAIASIAYRERAPIVDGNVARVAARLFEIEAEAGSPALMRSAWDHEQRMVDACSEPRDFNQGVMELGATVCTPARPRCDACPVERFCGARRSGREEALPLARPRRQATRMSVRLFLVRDADGRILLRRETGPLMTAMYHLPHGDDALLPGTPLAIGGARPLGAFRHTVTTRAIEFEVCEGILEERIADDAEYLWLDPADLATVAHPSYVAKALRMAGVRGGSAHEGR